MRIVYTTHLWSYWVCFRMRKLPVERSRIGQIQASPKKKVVTSCGVPLGHTTSCWRVRKRWFYTNRIHLKDGQSFKPVLKLSRMDNWRLGDFCKKSTRQKQGLKILDLWKHRENRWLTNQLFAGKQDGFAWNGLNQKHGTLVLVQNDININVTWMHINIAHLCSFRIEMGMSQHCSRLPKLTEPIGTQLFSSPTSPPQCFTKNSGRNWKWHFNSPREFTRPSWCCCQPVTFSSRTAVRT